MLNRVRQLKKESEGIKAAGFTIIEVMIVLAIAGLIMAIVFLAIPALQRNNRNTQRKNDASRISGQIDDFVTNNNGKLPTHLQFTSTAPTGSGVVPLDLQSEKFSIIDTSANVARVVCTNSACAPSTAPAEDSFVYLTNANCGVGTNTPAFTASSRAYAIYYGIEGTTKTQCLSS